MVFIGKDMWKEIFSYLNESDHLILRKVCKDFNNISKNVIQIDQEYDDIKFYNCCKNNNIIQIKSYISNNEKIYWRFRKMESS